MAEEFVQCKACGKEFSKSAQSCPSCGKANPDFVRRMWKIGIIFGIIAIAIIIAAGVFWRFLI